MRKNKNKKTLGSLFLGIILPFFTVWAIATVSLVVFIRISKVSNGNSSIVIPVMFLTILALSILFVVGDKIQRKITSENPAKEILEATEKIAKGDFSVRLETVHPYEKYNDFDLIKENLNAMAKELQKSEILKADFISNVSHELKTPLSIIQNYVFMLQGKLDEETKKKYTTTVITATEKLTNLVTNILKLNKLENQELTPTFSNVKLNDMLAETILNFEDLIDKKKLEIECNLSEVSVYSVESYLDIIWNNLISNAIKFTGEGGKITVNLNRDVDDVIIEVTDTGIGISKDIGERIFDKFYQGDTSHSGEGNGLGLALVKKVIDKIGGEISVFSELGKGTTFKVVLKGNFNEI